MKKTILIIERIVVEALEGKELAFSDLLEQTGMNGPLLQAVLDQLRNRGIITYEKKYYSLNWSQKDFWLPLLQDKEGTKAELKELFSALVNERFNNNPQVNLNVKKVWLNKAECFELKRKFSEIDSFLESVRANRTICPVKEITKEKQVLFYGASTYEDLVDGILKAS